MGLERFRRKSPPRFEQWLVQYPEVRRMSHVHELYEAITERDMTLERNGDGRLERVLKVATVDVFYQTGVSKYRLQENRYTILPGKVPKAVVNQVLQGDMSGVRPSRERPDRTSLSERIKLDGETREHATVRAIQEEMFGLALRGRRIRSLWEYPHLERTVRKALHFGEPSVVRVSADASDASFPGLAARYSIFPATITFTPDMKVPIKVVDGEPQPLIEFDKNKFINIYKWKKVS